MSESDRTAPINRMHQKNRNITVHGRRTSIRLDEETWAALQEIARREGMSVHTLASAVETRREQTMTLSAALRVLTIAYFRAAATETGHDRAGHGTGTLDRYLHRLPDGLGRGRERDRGSGQDRGQDSAD